MKNKKGFSLIELIIVVVLIGVLSVVSFVAIQRTRTRAMNEKVLDDMMAIYNALEDYQRDHQGKFPIPQPDGNQNILCYFADATYAHDCDHAAVAFRQGMIDNNLLTKRYLREVPTDPRTGSRYMYGVTNDGKYFQVAGNYEREDGTYEARTTENIARGFHLPSLIRSFDGADFVIDKETYLPYSPDHLVLTARLENVNGIVEVNGDPAENGQVLRQNDVVVADPGTADIYFSDGSVTHLSPGQKNELVLKHMKVDKNDADGTFTKILLRLKAGKIWSKVVRLASESEFRVETNAAIAGVRGTEFGVDAFGNVKVKSGEVWEEEKVGEEPPAEEVMDIPEPPEGDAAYDVPEDAQPDDYEDFYQVIQLNTGMQPHILSVEEGGKITVRNVNHFVDEVDAAVGLDRSIQVTHLAAYDADNISTETGEPTLLIKQPITPGSNGDPHVFQSSYFLNHSVILRFEDRDPDAEEVLHASTFSDPPIHIESMTELNESEIYEEDVVDEIPLLTIMSPSFLPVGETGTLGLGTEPPVDGVIYTVGATDENICTVSAEPYEITAVGTGDCVLDIGATMPDGTTEIPGETVTVEIIEASSNLLLLSPFDGEELFILDDTMPIIFTWGAPNASADVTFTINVDGTDSGLGHEFEFGTDLGIGSHNWAVTMEDADGNTETKESSFTITQLSAEGADFTIKDSDDNVVSDNLVVHTDSVYLEVDVAVPDANYTYQWTGSLPIAQNQGQSTTATIYDLTPHIPKPYTIILTVMDNGVQVDQSSKQLTVTYEPMSQITAISFVDDSNNPVSSYQVDADQDVMLSSLSETPVMITGMDGQEAVPGNYVNMDCTFSLMSGEGTVSGSVGNYIYYAPPNAAQDEIQCNLAKGTILDIGGIDYQVDPVNDLNAIAMMDVVEGLDYICMQNGGYWDGEGCWFLGGADESCDMVCNGAELNCVAGDWNDIDGAACNAITGGIPQTGAELGYAPHYHVGLDRCYERHPDFIYVDPNTVCNSIPDAGKQRVCKCE